MAMQMPGSLVPPQPVLDKGAAASRVSQLKEPVNALVRCVGIAWVAGERALDELDPDRDLAGFDVGPAEIAEKPPVVTPMRCQFFKQRQLRLMVIAPSAEAEEPKDAERQ